MAVIINGITITGDCSNVVVSNNKVFVNGKDVTPDAKEISISVEGNVNSIKADVVKDFKVKGDVESVQTASGDVEINGDVKGSVSTMSGDVDCHNIGGSVSTMSGNIKSRKL